jgi:hypothetical protein
MPGVADHATHLLPDLETVAEQLARDPSGMMSRAFPDSDPGSGSRAIVGPRSGLPPVAADTLDAALTAERRRLLEVGASALEVLRSEGPAATLSPEAQLGIEAIVSIARPALLLNDGAFGDPPPPWDAILGPRRQSIRNAAMSVGRIGVPGLPQIPYAGTGFLVADDVVMTNCHVARVFSQLGPDGEWTFQSGLEVNLDFFEDPDARLTSVAPSASTRIEGVIGIHPHLDLALLRIAPADPGDEPARPLSVMSHDPRDVAGRNIYVLGYPAPDYRSDAALQRPLLRQAAPAGGGDGAAGEPDHTTGPVLHGRRAGRRLVPRRVDARRQLRVLRHRPRERPGDRPALRRQVHGVQRGGRAVASRRRSALDRGGRQLRLTRE